MTFGAGVSTVRVGLAYGSREVLKTQRERLAAWTPGAKPIMGAALLLAGAAASPRASATGGQSGEAEPGRAG